MLVSFILVSSPAPSFESRGVVGTFTVVIAFEPAKSEEIVTTDGGTITFPDADSGDGETSIVIPPGALNESTTITITRLDPSDDSVPGSDGSVFGLPVAVYKFGPEGLVFNKPVTIQLHYPDADNDGKVDGTEIQEANLEIKLWDGVEWISMGGTVDTDLNVVSAQMMHFSIYAVYPASPLRDDDYRPRPRIITPAYKDGKNDFAQFGGAGNIEEISIYTVNGRRIRQVRDISIWDGKDDGGALVESGLYVYQIKLKDSSKRVNGVIVVAK